MRTGNNLHSLELDSTKNENAGDIMEKRISK